MPWQKWSKLLLFLLILCLIAQKSDSISQEEENILEIYLTKEQAPHAIFPEAENIHEENISVGPDLRKKLEQKTKQEVEENSFTTFTARKNGKILGYAVIVHQVGKFKPITFICGVTSEGKLKDFEVMAYRESKGNEIRMKRFRYQFRNKTLKNPLRINYDIINITGATYSVRSSCVAMKKALALVQEVYLNNVDSSIR